MLRTQVFGGEQRGVDWIFVKTDPLPEEAKWVAAGDLDPSAAFAVLEVLAYAEAVTDARVGAARVLEVEQDGKRVFCVADWFDESGARSVVSGPERPADALREWPLVCSGVWRSDPSEKLARACARAETELIRSALTAKSL